MKTLQKITNADITQITKVGAHVKTRELLKSSVSGERSRALWALLFFVFFTHLILTEFVIEINQGNISNRYLTVFNNVISEYRGTVNRTELIKNCICYFKPNIKSQQYKQNNVLMFYSYYFSKASHLQTKQTYYPDKCHIIYIYIMYHKYTIT